MINYFLSFLAILFLSAAAKQKYRFYRSKNLFENYLCMSKALISSANGNKKPRIDAKSKGNPFAVFKSSGSR
jgi:hypothetical protein